MIDLHCHIIPGVDDGAEDCETALAMAKMAWEHGTKVIAATSHFNRPDQPMDMEPKDILSALSSFKTQLQQENCPIRIAQGMELFATPDLPWLLDHNQYLTLNGSDYLLVEFFFDERLSFMNWAIDEIQNHGLTPVIAHPERYEAIHRRPGVLADWFSQGSIIQLNKGSILSELGERAEDTAWWILERGLAHAVASDAHSDEFRTPDLEDARRLLEKELDEPYAALLFEGNPRRLLRNEPPAQSL